MAYKFYGELDQLKKGVRQPNFPLYDIITKGTRYFNLYQNNPDGSFKARSDFYTELHQSISYYYDTQIFAKKTFRKS